LNREGEPGGQAVGRGIRPHDVKGSNVMNNKEILMVADAVSNEKGVSKDVIFKAIESALATATKKRHGEDEIDCQVEIDRQSGNYVTYRVWTVVSDEEYLDPNTQLTLDEAREKQPDIELGGVVREKID